jgi:predicted S18 family serine protease
MRKNILIAALTVCCTSAILSLSSAVNNMSYWKHRAKAAESLISVVEKDNPDYILDILCEGDEWAEWVESK